MKGSVRYRVNFLPSHLCKSCPHSSSSVHLRALLPRFLPSTFVCIFQPLCPLLFIRQTQVREQAMALLFHEDVRFLGRARVFLCPTTSTCSREATVTLKSHIWKRKYICNTYLPLISVYLYAINILSLICMKWSHFNFSVWTTFWYVVISYKLDI